MARAPGGASSGRTADGAGASPGDRAQACGVRAEHLGRPGRRAEPGRARAGRPHERELVEARERRGDRRAVHPRRARDRGRRRGPAHGVEHEHRLEHVQRQLVEPGERALEARAVHRARGEREQRRGGGRGEVGTPREQGDQRVVVALAQRLAVRRSPLGPGGGHPSDATRQPGGTRSALACENGSRDCRRRPDPPISSPVADLTAAGGTDRRAGHGRRRAGRAAAPASRRPPDGPGR